MPIHNADIAEAFDELADLLELQDANPFRVRAYRNAARVVESWPGSLATILARDKGLPRMPGLGSDLTGKVEEFIARKGKLQALEEARRHVPPGVVQLLRIPGMGPKKVDRLRKELGVKSVADVKKACEAGAISALRGFGKKTEDRILAEIRELETGKIVETRIRLSVAEQVAEPFLAELRRVPGVREAIAAGSYRRRRETVGDLDILVACDDSSAVMRTFTEYDEVREVLARGATRSTVRLRSGLNVDLRVVPARSYGAALHYFTGSKDHNIAVRALGVRRGLKLNEYGIFRGKRRIGGKTEEEVFAAVGLPWIPPELRENRGEIEAAQKEKLPRLVELREIRGDLHAHTKATDGRLGIEEMARAAKARGYEYLAITDHTQHLSVTKGMDPKRLMQQIRRIDALNERGHLGILLLKSAEVDILDDGSLDLPDSVLRHLDLTVCSVHFKLALSEARQTERVLRAMDNRYFTVLGHPTGRLIGRRRPEELKLDRIVRAAAERGCLLEVNAQPERLDLTDVHCQLARDNGVKIVISTDAHSDSELDFMRFGVDQARRGWLAARDVANTRPWDELRKLLKRR